MKSKEATDSSSSRVIVVEDNSDDQELLLIQLRKMNFHRHVKFVNDGKKALSLLTSENREIVISEICVVFLDLKLPRMGGVELLRELRARPETKNLPVIVMSGLLEPATLEECKKLKVLKFIAKPITYQTFSTAVASVFHLPKPNRPESRKGDL